MRSGGYYKRGLLSKRFVIAILKLKCAYVQVLMTWMVKIFYCFFANKNAVIYFYYLNLCLILLYLEILLGTVQQYKIGKLKNSSYPVFVRMHHICM